MTEVDRAYRVLVYAISDYAMDCQDGAGEWEPLRAAIHAYAVAVKTDRTEDAGRYLHDTATSRFTGAQERCNVFVFNRHCVTCGRSWIEHSVLTGTQRNR